MVACLGWTTHLVVRPQPLLERTVQAWSLLACCLQVGEPLDPIPLPQSNNSTPRFPAPLLIAASPQLTLIMPPPMHYPQGTFAVRMLTRLVRTTTSRAAATALPATTWTQRGKKKCLRGGRVFVLCCWCGRNCLLCMVQHSLLAAAVCGRVVCSVCVYICVCNVLV